MLPNIDLVIAGAIFLIALVVFFLVHIHALPVKTVPYVIGSLVALVGFEIFKAHRASKLGKQIADQKKELDERRVVLDVMKKDLDISEAQHNEARSKLDEYEAAHVKTIEMLKEKDDAERAKIRDMSTTELFAKYANPTNP